MNTPASTDAARLRVYASTARPYSGSSARRRGCSPPRSWRRCRSSGAVNAVNATLALDVHLHDTYFGVGSLHLEIDVVLLAFLGGLHLWWPQLTGRAEAGRGGWVGPALLWAGMIVTAVAQLALGHEGMPRRYYAYLPEFEGLHRAATIGAGLQALALPWIAARLARSRSRS